MKKFTLEVCVDSFESAINAWKGKATRLELCANLIIGGTTPSTALFKQVQNAVDIPINVLIRPRFGDFCYTNAEFNQILEDVKSFKELGANGVVVGILTKIGELDTEKMSAIIESADGMDITLHRAFDMCKDPFKTLNDAKKLNINSILTSGGKNSCIDGADLISALILKNKCEILVGSGVNEKNIQQIYEKTGAICYHTSGKEIIDSEMIYRNENVFMGISNISEYNIYRTNTNKILEIYNKLCMF